ncbi:MAG: hypothetical protein IJA67_02750 [Oscillospiraceae bacterium]|nr:hypothetical protein [Oscillospiraceae bacterium]
MKRICMAFLSIFLAAALFSSCAPEASSGEENMNTGTTLTESTPPEDILVGLERANLPKNDFGGVDFVFFHEDSEATASTGDAWRMIDSDQQNGEILNDEIYKRNKKVEELYGVVIDVVQNSGDSKQIMKNSVNADDNAYQAFFASLTNMLPVSQENYLADWLDMPHLNTAADWWDQSVVDAFTIKNKLYMCTGDISPLVNCRVYSIVFNKDMCAELGLELPYASVFDGNWTLEKFNYYTANVNSDINGDSKMDFDDRWGYLSQNGNSLMMYFSAGGTVVQKNSDSLVLSINSERNISLATAALLVSIDETRTLMGNPLTANGGWAAVSNWFAEGGSLMRASVFEPVPRDYRSMETDFGVLPFPKLDEAQDRYYTFPEATGFVISFPTTCDREMCGLIVEAMAAESTYTVKKAFYETCLNEKSVRDEESQRILDIIFNSKQFDIGYILDFGKIASRIINLESKRNTEVASAFASITAQAEEALEKFLESYENN